MQSLKILFVLLLLSLAHHAQASALDVLSYTLTIEPDIKQKSVRGSVLIRYKLPKNENSFILNSGNLEIDEVRGSSIKSFTKRNDTLFIELYPERKELNELSITYRGKPAKGLHFDEVKQQAYTLYFTNYWMVSNFSMSDKARITLNLLVDKDLDCISNGELMEVKEKDGKRLHRWQQPFESPAYTFGFVIGKFQSFKSASDKVTIINYAPDYSPQELQQIFIETPKMISFFEQKSGIKYGHSSYFQILIGSYYQEMSGFSILKESYGKLVLKDSTETNLISHELAHQWWGNRITCKNTKHFWLNEAIATYMSAAYNEQRFGKFKYQADINSYFQVYQDLKRRNKDKPLVFKDWSNPSRDERNIVYFKGAYVLHLLRQELGDQMFWEALKYYSQQYFDKSVSTLDFKEAFEERSGRNLDEFFNEWVF